MNQSKHLNNVIKQKAIYVPPPFIPALYQQVEYLQSSGTQYINTGVEGWDNLVVQLDQEIASYSGNEFSFFGGDDTTFYGKFNYAGVFNMYSNFILQIGSPYIQYGTKDNLRHVHTFDAVNKVAYTDNNSPVSGAGLLWWTTSQCEGKPFRLFLRFPNKSVGSLKMYGATFTRSGNIIREFIPCYRISDSKPGLYDLATQTFFTNAGTGEFTVGGDV